MTPETKWSRCISRRSKLTGDMVGGAEQRAPGSEMFTPLS